MSKEIKEMAEILLKASEKFYGTKCDKECADYEALILHEVGYRKQEPKNIIPVGKGCDVHCGTLEQYDNFLREISKDTIKEFAEKIVEDLLKAIESNIKVSSEAMKNGELETYIYCSGKIDACFGIINFIENLKKNTEWGNGRKR